MNWRLICIALLSGAGCQSVVRDGTTAERAIQLQAADHGAGLLAEHAWLNQHLPGFRMAGGGASAAGEELISFAHRTEVVSGKLHSIFTVQLPDGRIRDVYFDQSFYFGQPTEEKSDPPPTSAPPHWDSSR